MIEQPSPPMPSARFFAVWTVFTLGTYLAVGSIAQLSHLAWGLWASQIVINAGLATIGWQLNGLSASSAFGLKRFEGRSFGLGLAFGAVNYFAWVLPLTAIAEAVFPASWLARFDSAQLYDRHSTIEVGLAMGAALVASPVCEELVFRGFIQRAFRDAPRGIVMTALIFSAFHFNPVNFIALFQLGVVFGLLAWRGGSVWPAIGAHIASNTVSTALFFATTKGAEVAWWVPVLLFIVGNVTLVGLVKFASGRLRVREPTQLVAIDRREPVRWFAPWVVGGLASLVVLLLVDWRGVALNWIDARKLPSEATRNQVKEKRREARAGELTFEEYEALLDQTKR